MKNSLMICLLIFPVFGALAQSGATSSFDVDGIKVIYKPTVKNIVNVSVYFRGGVGNYTHDQAGIERLAVFGAVQCGNAQYNANDFEDRSDFYGIAVSASAGLDNARISLNCIAKYFNEGWDLLSSAVVGPVYHAADFDKMKQKLIGQIREADGNPDSRLRAFAIQNAFTGTPYETDPDGTETTLTALSTEDVHDYYYKTLLNKSRIFIVVVGNISKADITAKIKAAFAAVPSQEYKLNIAAAPVFSSNSSYVEERSIATNYILGIVNAPSYASTDYVPFLLAFSELHGMLFSEIRTKRHLSYAPDATVHALLLPFADVYVSTTNPKAAVAAIADMINREENMNLDKNSLEQIKALYITGSYMKEQSTNSIAENLGRAEILGNWEMAEQLPDLVSHTTRNEMSKAFKKYVAGIVWSYLGDKGKADEAASSFNISVN